jgi:CBS domain-containing protein
VNAGELCIRDVVTAESDETAETAAARMRARHVGDLIVVEPRDGRTVPIGIVTDRDLVLSVLATGREPGAVLLGQIMGRVLVTVDEQTEITAVLSAMKENGVRRMPVIDADGALAGILTYDDLLEWMAEELAAMVTLVRKEQRLERGR